MLAYVSKIQLKRRNMFLRINKIILLIFVSVLCIGCDQISKFAAKNLIEPDTVISLLGDTIRLQLVKNEGAFLSMGSSLPDKWQFWIFTISVALALFILVVYYIFSESLSKLSSLGLSLIISGGLGNLIDRIIYKGLVIDFLNFGIGNLRTGILNIADMAITFGIILLLYAFLINKRDRNDFN
jgi:signal peptidase II